MLDQHVFTASTASTPISEAFHRLPRYPLLHTFLSLSRYFICLVLPCMGVTETVEEEAASFPAPSLSLSL